MVSSCVGSPEAAKAAKAFISDWEAMNSTRRLTQLSIETMGHNPPANVLADTSGAFSRRAPEICARSPGYCVGTLARIKVPLGYVQRDHARFGVKNLGPA